MSAAVPLVELDPPSFRQEIERKAILELERLVLGVRNGHITVSAFKEAALTLYNASSGVIDPKTTAILAAAPGYFPDDDSAWQVTLMHDQSSPKGNVLALGWNPKTNSVRVAYGDLLLDQMPKHPPWTEAKTVYDDLLQKFGSKMKVL